MPWIVLIPPNEVGGAVQVAVVDEDGSVFAHHWPPTRFTSHQRAQDCAKRFRCGIVVKTDEPLKLATSSHVKES